MTDEILDLSAPRVDVKCCGAHVEEAGELDLVVFEALDTAVREVANNTIIFDVSADGDGGVDQWDSDLRSPYTFRTYNLTIAQQYEPARRR